MYRDAALRRYQYYVNPHWTGPFFELVSHLRVLLMYSMMEQVVCMQVRVCLDQGKMRPRWVNTCRPTRVFFSVDRVP